MIPGVTLAESMGTWVVVIVVVLALSLAFGGLVMLILRPVMGWVLEPLEGKGDDENH